MTKKRNSDPRFCCLAGWSQEANNICFKQSGDGRASRLVPVRVSAPALCGARGLQRQLGVDEWPRVSSNKPRCGRHNQREYTMLPSLHALCIDDEALPTGTKAASGLKHDKKSPLSRPKKNPKAKLKAYIKKKDSTLQRFDFEADGMVLIASLLSKSDGATYCHVAVNKAQWNAILSSKKDDKILYRLTFSFASVAGPLYTDTYHFNNHLGLEHMMHTFGRILRQKLEHEWKGKGTLIAAHGVTLWHSFKLESAVDVNVVNKNVDPPLFEHILNGWHDDLDFSQIRSHKK